MTASVPVQEARSYLLCVYSEKGLGDRGVGEDELRVIGVHVEEHNGGVKRFQILEVCPDLGYPGVITLGVAGVNAVERQVREETGEELFVMLRATSDLL